jgi:hypothetical protein
MTQRHTAIFHLEKCDGSDEGGSRDHPFHSEAALHGHLVLSAVCNQLLDATLSGEQIYADNERDLHVQPSLAAPNFTIH